MKLKNHVLRMVEQNEKSSLSSQKPWNDHTRPGLDCSLLGLREVGKNLWSQCCLGFLLHDAESSSVTLSHVNMQTQQRWTACYADTVSGKCLQTPFPTKPPNPSYLKMLVLPVAHVTPDATTPIFFLLNILSWQNPSLTFGGLPLSPLNPECLDGAAPTKVLSPRTHIYPQVPSISLRPAPQAGPRRINLETSVHAISKDILDYTCNF